jgi:hypothetical protein
MDGRSIEPTGSHDFGPCECCGKNSRTVWGYVYRGGVTEAVYYVHWSLGKVAEYGAHFDLIIGQWGDGSEDADRQTVSLEFQPGLGVMVKDAGSRKIASERIAGKAMSREDVIGTSLAQQAFDIFDTIWLQDGRIAEVTQSESAVNKTKN